MIHGELGCSILDEKTVKSGHATSRAAAMNSVVWLIDKALKAKAVKAPHRTLSESEFLPGHSPVIA